MISEAHNTTAIHTPIPSPQDHHVNQLAPNLVQPRVKLMTTPMPTVNTPRLRLRSSLLALLALILAIPALHAQQPTIPQQPTTPPATDSDAGPQTDNGTIILKKKKDADQPPVPEAPPEPKVKNPNNETYSLRVDVPIVNLDVNVILDKTHQFVPGLQANNFQILEDGVPQHVTSVRTSQTPITAVMLLEFAATNWYAINDMRNAAYGFFRSLRPDDYIAVVTFDLRTHILTDFTNDKGLVAESLQSLMIPGFSEINTFDALYETLDRTSRIEGRKYIILIGTGRDTFSKLTLDKILAKVKASQNTTIFTIGTGALLNEMNTGTGMGASIANLNYLQAQNQLRTFASMTGGMSFSPLFQGELPDIFATINNSIRNQYILTYRPTNNHNDGTYRKVKVSLVDNEGHPLQMQDEKHKPLKYSVIARDGYKAKQEVE
jgi:VWFA-related protein